MHSSVNNQLVRVLSHLTRRICITRHTHSVTSDLNFCSISIPAWPKNSDRISTGMVVTAKKSTCLACNYGTSRSLMTSEAPPVPVVSTSKPVMFGKPRNKGEDPYITSLQEAKSLAEGLQIVEDQKGLLDIPQIVWTCSELFRLLKNSNVSPKGAWQSGGIQKLVKAIRKTSRNMIPTDLITCLKLLVFLGPPGSDTTLQMLLKLLTKQANSLELSQIFYLHFLIFKMKEETRSPLSTALEYALPVVFESQLEKEAQHEGLQELTNFLHYSSMHSLSERAFKLIVEEILKKTENMTPQQAMSVFWSIADYKHDGEYLGPLVNLCYNRLTEAIHTFTLEEMNTIMSKAARKYLKRVDYFYNEDFVQAYCNRLMTKTADPTHVLWSSKNVSIMKHVHLEYLENIGDIIAKNPTDVLNEDFLFISLIRCFSGSNYRPEKWSKFEPLLLDHPALTKDLGLQEIPLALDFLALGGFPEQLITKLYSPEELPKLDLFIQKTPFTSAASLALLYNTVKILYPSYSGPLPPLSMIEKWKQLVRHANSKKHYRLSNALRSGFGGENYVLNGVYHDGLHIDHAIVMRKGGFPIAMTPSGGSSSNLFKDGLRDIQKPAESVIVLVKVFYKEAYANNTNRLRGYHALEQKVLDHLGHPLISVDGERWLELPDYEKIPSLMHQIREKIDKFQWNQSNSDVIPR